MQRPRRDYHRRIYPTATGDFLKPENRALMDRMLEASFRETASIIEGDDMGEGFDIGWVRQQLVDGKRVRRAGWNGKGMWLALVGPIYMDVDHGGLMAALAPKRIEAHVCMRTADSKLVPWLCSQTDFLAIDWELAD